MAWLTSITMPPQASAEEEEAEPAAASMKPGPVQSRPLHFVAWQVSFFLDLSSSIHGRSALSSRADSWPGACLYVHICMAQHYTMRFCST